MMQPRLQILIIIASFAVFLIILELIRKGRLREEYSLIWLVSAAVIFLLAIFRGSLTLIASFVQVDYPPSFIFMVGLGLVIVIQLMQTIAISRLTMQNRDLAQQMAILRWRIRHGAEAADVAIVSESELASDETIINTTERDVTENAEAEIVGDWPRRGNLRSDEALGSAKEVAHPSEATDGRQRG
jgi:hypothetical protein